MRAKTCVIWLVIQLISACTPLSDLSNPAAPNRIQLQATSDQSLNQATLTPKQSRELTRAKQLNEAAHALWEQGRYREGLPLCEEALKIQETILGLWHPEVAFTLNYLGSIHQQEGRADDARLAYERALAIREKAFGPNSIEVAKSLHNLAEWRREHADYIEARTLLVRALSIHRHQLGELAPSVALNLTALAQIEVELGASLKAHELYERALNIQESVPGVEPYDLGTTLNNLGGLHHRAGNFEQAMRYYERARALFEPISGRGQDFFAATLTNLGTLYQHSSDLGRARRYYEHALRIHEKLNGPNHPSVGTTLVGFSGVIAQMGDLDGALQLTKRAQGIFETAYGSNHPTLAVIASRQADLYQQLHQSHTALAATTRALKIRETKLGRIHPMVAATLTDLANLQIAVSDYAGALESALRARSIQENTVGLRHPDAATTDSLLGQLYWHNGETKVAGAYFEEALAIRESSLGTRHPDVALALSDLGQFRAAQGDLLGARDVYERARQIHGGIGRLNADLDDNSLRRLSKSGAYTLREYARVLALILQTPGYEREGILARETAFEVAEEARSWIVQTALAKAFSRAGAVSPESSQLVRQVEDLRQRRQSLWNALDKAYGKLTAQRDPKVLEQLQHDLDITQSALAAAVTQLNKAFPRYAEIAAPAPIKHLRLQETLHSDEVLLSFLSLHDRVLVWVVHPKKPLEYFDLHIAQATLRNLIQRLNASTRPSFQGSTSSSSSELPSYDVTAAHELYTLLLKPLEPHLREVKQLIIVPDELLLTVPFGALIQNNNGSAFERLAKLRHAPAKFTQQDFLLYTELPWLIRTYGLTILPSASSLNILRHSDTIETSASEPFIGIGDPVLDGSGNTRGGSMLIAGRGAQVSRDNILSLPRLPSTKTELLTLASVLGVDPSSHVFLAEQATETRISELNNSGRLGRAKVLSFATHGLLAGELRGLMQPALVLTPPETTSSDENDGLLTLEEILRLQLPHTQWVVLSACNTAGGDGSGEGLSGLARAFFFAGAKALLVSQWSVDDEATKALMTEIFRRYGSSTSVAPAKALQAGMLALLKQAATDSTHAYFAHPYAWAPFLLVGDGVLPHR